MPKYRTPVLGGKNKAWYGEKPGTIEIQLTKGKVAIIDEEDWPKVRGFRWRADERYGYSRTCYAKSFFRWSRNCMQTYSMHRVIMGLDGVGLEIDHVDENGLHNCKSNLRPCTHGENKRNVGRLTNNTSGYKGVSWCRNSNKWKASIEKDARTQHIGLFIDAIEAARAYNKKAKELFGEFARLNEIPETAS